MSAHVGTYDKHKLVRVVLPVLALLVLVINPYWNIPHQDILVGVIIGVWAFLSALWGNSSKQKPQDSSSLVVDGYVHSESSNPDTGIPDLSIVIVRDPNEMLTKDHLTFKVGRPPNNR